MENNQINNSGNRKKLLVPLVVLLLCGVALTGAAYAYATTITSQENSVNGDYISIDLFSDESAQTQITGAVEAGQNFKVYTEKTVGGQLVAKTEGTTFTKTVYVHVASDIAGAKFTLAPTVTEKANTDPSNILTVAIAAASTTNVAADSTVAITLTFTVANGVTLGSYATQAALDTAVNAYVVQYTFSVVATQA